MAAIFRARTVARLAGIPTGVQLVRANSAFNEVWIAGDTVLRMSRQPSSTRLSYEATITKMLPAECLHPPVLGIGRSEYGEWMLTRRADGVVLSSVWHDLTLAQREDAVRQLARAVRALHQTPAPRDDYGTIFPPFAEDDSLECPYQLGAQRIVALARRAHDASPVNATTCNKLIARVTDLAREVGPLEETHLIHGDLHFGNVLWDKGKITAVIDNEWTRPGPRDLDLDVLLRICAAPELHIADSKQRDVTRHDYTAVPGWLHSEYPEWFAHPKLYERLELYAYALDVRDLLLATPRLPIDQLPEHHPLRRIERTLRGRSHLSLLHR
jgi:aminoglycoside phosphotransferase (APT) family kinase protein